MGELDIYADQGFGNTSGFGTHPALLIVDFVNGFADPGQFGVKNISVLTPYQPIVDEQVRRFFGESGYNVVNLVGFKCDTANSIAHTPQKDVLRAVLDDLDGDDVEAIVQVGTNMSNSNLFPALEKQLGRPVIPINVATIWHAYRAIGIEDQFVGRGWLFERF